MIPDIHDAGIGNINTNNINVPNVGISGINIRSIYTVQTNSTNIMEISDKRVWMINQPYTGEMDVPVTVQIGKPIVDMPGCVAMQKENARRKNGVNVVSENKNLVNDDPKGNVVLCDGGMPYFNPVNYEANRLQWQTIYGEQEYNQGGVDTGDPPDPIAPETPKPPVTGGNTSEDQPCPPPNARRIGDLNQAGTEKVKEYELQRDPKNPDEYICVTLWEDIGFVEKYLPAANVVTTTASIAVVATSSALLAKPLADLLLKVIKPAIKKAMAKIQKMMGKKEKILSLQERKLKQKEANAAVKAARLLQGK